MALQSALTNDQLADIRSGAYQALQYVCLVPNTVVVQFQPSAAPALDVFAEIAVGTVASGDVADIKQGQTVIFSTTTDYKATEFLRTRVRKVSGVDTLYVGENSATLTTSHYVTVLDTYEIQEKLRRSETLVDWDITYRKLLPVEAALPSAVVLSNGVTSYSPTAVPKAMDATATTSFTHLWESSNGSDSISNGTTASPTITLDAAAFRWLRYTFTDSNGNANYRVIPCWTVPKDYSSVVSLGFMGQGGEVANVSFDAELGWTATVPAWDGITTLLNKTLTVIASDEWYDDTRQSIRTNINHVGYLQTETVQTNADERFGRISEARFTVEGFGHQLARQNISPVTIIRTATPAAWDDIKDPTPGRMLTYRLTEYSTASNLMAISLPSDDGDFIGDDLTLSTEKALDDLQQIAEVINAEIQFDVTGKLEMCRDINYLGDTERDAAPVVATLTPADFTEQYSIEYEYGRTTAQATITGGAYNTTRDVYDLFEAVTPAEARYSEGDPLELGNQVLTTDATAADSMEEIKQRAANFLAANNPTWTLRVGLKDQWHFLVPDVGAWFKFTIAASDTVRGRAFGSSDRWQLVQIDVSSNAQDGTRDVNAVFRHETRSTGASVRVAPIVNDPEADIVNVPAAFPSLAGGDLGLTGGFHYDALDPAPPSEANPVGANCELGGFRPKAGVSYETTNTALNGEYVTWRVRGSGLLHIGGGSETVDFTANDGGFATFDASNEAGSQIVGSHSGGTGWGDTHETSFPSGNSIRGIGIRKTVSYSNPTATLTYDTTQGAQGGAYTRYGARIIFEYSGVAVADSGTGEGFGTGEVTLSYIGPIDRVRLQVQVGTSASASDPGGSATFTDFTIEEDIVYGDAFYYWRPDDEATPYDTGEGLLIEAVQPTAPPYVETHEYEGALTATSGTIIYTFNSPYSTSLMSNFSFQIISCFNGVP